MAYLNAWSETMVPGSTLANQIDEKFRLFSEAIRERMETELVVSWTADPVVAKDAIKGAKIGKYMFIGGSTFRELNGSLKAVELNPNFLAVFRGSARVIAPLLLPPGVTVKLIEWMVDRGSVTNYTWRFIGVNFGSPANESVFATETVTTAGLHISSSAVLAHTIAINTQYYLDLDTAGADDNNSLHLYGVRITYDAPSSLTTV